MAIDKTPYLTVAPDTDGEFLVSAIKTAVRTEGRSQAIGSDPSCQPDRVEAKINLPTDLTTTGAKSNYCKRLKPILR